MFVGVLQVELFIADSASLKSKRHVIKQLKDKIRAKFNVSVAEVAYQDKWQRSGFAVACVGSDKKIINSVLSKINNLVEAYHQAELIETKMEII